jgi:RimJ/RimL family protein N-acetyltransferase
METKNLFFEQLTAAHADVLFPILGTPAVLAFIEPSGNYPTIDELRAEYGTRARGPVSSTTSTEQWFNMAIGLKSASAPAIGRLEATSYGEFGEVAYLLGEAWWGKGLAFEAMLWWHDYLAVAAPETQWWATVHPENYRSIRLLKRLGYEEVELSKCPELHSYDLGDCCFQKKSQPS